MKDKTKNKNLFSSNNDMNDEFLEKQRKKVKQKNYQKRSFNRFKYNK